MFLFTKCLILHKYSHAPSHNSAQTPKSFKKRYLNVSHILHFERFIVLLNLNAVVSNMEASQQLYEGHCWNSLDSFLTR